MEEDETTEEWVQDQIKMAVHGSEPVLGAMYEGRDVLSPEEVNRLFVGALRTAFAINIKLA